MLALRNAEQRTHRAAILSGACLEDNRSEPRHGAAIEGATLLFRGHKVPGEVINISSRGTAIACPIAPRLGETIIVEFDRCTPIHAFVRWMKDGQLGLRFGHEIILA